MTVISKLTGGLNVAFDAMTNTPLKKYSLVVTSALLALGALKLTQTISEAEKHNRRILSDHPNDPTATGGLSNCRKLKLITFLSTMCFSALCVGALKQELMAIPSKIAGGLNAVAGRLSAGLNAVTNTPLKKYSCLTAFALLTIVSFGRAYYALTHSYRLEGEITASIRVTTKNPWSENVSFVTQPEQEVSRLRRQQAAALRQAKGYTIGAVCLSALCVGIFRR